MAEQKFLVDINLNGQELKSAVLHTSPNAAALLGVAGQVAYDTGKKTVWYNDGSKWIEVGGILGIVETAPIKVVTNSGIATISITAATPTTTGDNGTYDGTGDGSMAGKDKEKLDNIQWGAQADQNSKEVPHAPAPSSDEGVVAEVESALHNIGTSLFIHKDLTKRPHNEIRSTDQVVGDITPAGTVGNWADEAQIVKYVQASVGTAGRPTKAFDPTGTDAGTAGFPKSAYGHPTVTFPGGTIKTGDHFILSKDGDKSGVSTLKIGDSLIAKKDLTTDDLVLATGTQLPANWDVIKASVIQDASYVTSTTPIKGKTVQAVSTDLADTKNIDDIITEHDPAKGKGDNTTFVTPLALQYYAKQFPLLTEISKDIAAGLKIGQITHGWLNKDVTVEAWITSTGSRLIGEIGLTNGVATINFNKAPITAWRMRVIGEDKS